MSNVLKGSARCVFWIGVGEGRGGGGAAPSGQTFILQSDSGCSTWTASTGKQRGSGVRLGGQ